MREQAVYVLVDKSLLTAVGGDKWSKIRLSMLSRDTHSSSKVRVDIYLAVPSAISVAP